MGISRSRLGGAKLPGLITEEAALAGANTEQRMFSALRARQAARYAVDVVDARAGMPAPDSAGEDDGRVAIRNDGLYAVEVTPRHGTEPTGSWGAYSNTGFRGAHPRYDVPASPQAGETYYNTSERTWYVGAQAEGSRVRWIHTADPENWIGHYGSQGEALAHAGGDGLAYTGSAVETLSSFAAGSNTHTERRWVRRSDHERERELIYETRNFEDYHQQAKLIDLRRSMAGERNAFFLFHYFNLPRTMTTERTFVASTGEHGTSTVHVSADNSRVSFTVDDDFSAAAEIYDGQKIIIEGLSSGAYRIAREAGNTPQEITYNSVAGTISFPLRIQQTGGGFTAGETVRVTVTNPFSHSGFSDPIPVEEWLALPRSLGTGGDTSARNLNQKILVVISRLSNVSIDSWAHARMALGRVTDSQMVTTFSHTLEVVGGTALLGLKIYLYRG